MQELHGPGHVLGAILRLFKATRHKDHISHEEAHFDFWPEENVERELKKREFLVLQEMQEKVDTAERSMKDPTSSCLQNGFGSTDNKLGWSDRTGHTGLNAVWKSCSSRARSELAGHLNKYSPAAATSRGCPPPQQSSRMKQTWAAG